MTAIAAPLRLRLVVPQVRPFGMDLITQALGMPLKDILDSLLDGEPTVRSSQVGVSDVYPLRLPDGEGAVIPLGSYGGEIGVGARDGLLDLTVPAPIAAQVRQRLAATSAKIVDEETHAVEGTPVLATRFGLRLAPGARVTWLLPFLGEFAVEAP